MKLPTRARFRMKRTQWNFGLRTAHDSAGRLRLSSKRRGNEYDQRKDERGPNLHGTPPGRRRDAATLGRQAGSVKALSPVLLPPPTAPG